MTPSAYVARYTYLDLMRGLAALAVVLSHYDTFLAAGQKEPFYALFWPFYDYGNVAVPLFWCLSGFVLAATYLGKEVSAGKFFIWRFSRLYPLHFVTLIYVAFAQWLALDFTGAFVGPSANGAGLFVAQLFLASSWGLDPGYSFNSPIWSVSVEVLVYALFFAALRVGLTGFFRSAALAFSFCTTFVFVIEYQVALCAGLFFAGIAIYHVVGMLGRRAAYLGIAALIASIGVSFALLATKPWLVHSAVVFFVVPSVLVLVASLDLLLPPVRKDYQWIGDSTYSIYLLHFPLIVTVVIIGRLVGLPSAESPIFLLAYVVAVVALSIPIYRNFEIPAQQLIRRRYRERQLKHNAA